MSNIGIVGSSFSEGGHGHWENEVYHNETRYFQEYLKDAHPHHNFYNAAVSGRGSERYLANVIHLKERYDITHLLIEIIQNRTVNHFWYNEEVYQTDLENWDANASYKYSVNDDLALLASSNNTKSYFIEKSIYNDFSNADISKWSDLNSYSLYKSTHLQVLAARDIDNTVKLCKMLGIVPIKWSFNLRLPYKCFEIDSKYELVAAMENDGLSYKDNTCDGIHLNDYGHQWAVKNYFSPLFEQFA